MKKITKESIAREIFEKNSFIETIYVTTNNKPFSVQSDAENYASNKFENVDSRKLKTFKREDLGVKAIKSKERKVHQVVSDIREAKSVDEINDLVKGDHRPYVKAQAKYAIELLNPTKAVNKSEDFKTVMLEKDKEIKELKESKAKEIKDLKAEKAKEIKDLKAEKDKEIKDLKAEKDKEIKELKESKKE